MLGLTVGEIITAILDNLIMVINIIISVMPAEMWILLAITAVLYSFRYFKKA
ncbi:hypothetical protein PD280_21340 [Virgibacillus salarius]|uniref:hypothetical protein n=1 Tax=Virgibacillus salarius TaxID=447199 RepID=UPI00249106BD|nr:hypothetical protein [Virgibacillus salarius]WBX80113.1 hypothetical protein PD280_21340 [Virgibacillus salarius]